MRVLNKKGSAIPLVMALSALVFIISYLVMNFLGSRRQGTEDELRALQAKMLAADIIEVGKYLLLYERVVYVTDPLKIDVKRQATRKEMLSQSYGYLGEANSFIMNACGGYDANAVEIGPLTADGSSVFCPYYIRNSMMDGSMFENMLLKMWASGGNVGKLVMNNGALTTEKFSRTPLLTRNASGAFDLDIDLNSAIRSSNEQFIRLHLNQNIIESMRRNGFTAKLRYTLYGQSTGFKTQTNERYVNVQAEVTFGNGLNTQTVNTTESVILYSSTVKDFALFMMYPETAGGAPTKKFSEAVNLDAASSISGRVFFNGDIDKSLGDLPTFYETVVITGQLNTAGYTFAQAQDLIARKFRKGIVMGFSAVTLINDGECISGMTTANDSSMYCKDPDNNSAAFTAGRYIEKNINNVCNKFPVTFNGGEFAYDTSTSTDAVVREQCKGSAPGKVFLSEGAMNVTVGGSHAFIVSPVKRLLLGAGSSLHGVVFGGYIRGSNVKIYSLGSLRKGLPGIASDKDLSAISAEASKIVSGVGVPLVNVALIKKAKIGD